MVAWRVVSLRKGWRVVRRSGLGGLVPRGVDHAAVRRIRSRPRLKVLIKEFFHAFFLCFFPDWAARFEFVDIDWLDIAK